MAISFVAPNETRRLDLSDGDWIEVRNRLGFGVAERMRSIAVRTMHHNNADGTPTFDVDMSLYNIERMAAYIVAWSARKPDGSPLKPDKDAFRNLTEETAREINDALDRHISDREEEAKTAGGNPTVSTTAPPSLSAAGSTGPTTNY